MKVRMPDGTIIEVAEGATYEDAMEAWEGQKQPVDQMGARPRIPAVPEMTAMEKVLSNAPSLPQGAQDFLSGAASTYRSAFGEGAFPKIGSGSGYETAGEILDPAALAVGGAGLRVARTLLPKTGVVTQGAAGGVAGGVPLGAVSEDSSALQGGIVGALFGGLIPGIAKLGAGTKEVVLRSMPGEVGEQARQRFGGQILNEAADTQQQAVLQQLQAAPAGMSAGQATVGANAPTFAAVQNIAEMMNPEVALAREQAQKAAREQSIRSFAKTEKELAQAVEDRALKADQNYAKAFKASLKKDKEIQSVLDNPFVQDTLPTVKKLVEAKGGPVSTTEQLQMIKKELDAKIEGTLASKPSANEAKALMEARDKLVGWLVKKNPDYAAALTDYATASKPIGEMQIGQAALNALKAPIGEKERSGSFVKQVAEETALLRNSTGFTQKELADQLSPQNMAKLNKVADELDVDQTFRERALKGRMAAGKQVGVEFALPNMLVTSVTLTNSVLGRLQQGAKEKTLKELAAILQDPKQTAVLMQNATKAEKNAIRFLRKAQETGALAGTYQEKEQLR